MDVARTKRRASPKLIPSWPFCTASRPLSLVAVEETTLLLAVQRSVGAVEVEDNLFARTRVRANKAAA